MPIQVLDQNTINQIAAGEVVERPASVVKELMENAIDAGATAVTAEIRDGGIGFIRITDNGCGIRREEIPLAFLRHSTSKIKSAEDLLTVSSLGFRGEALSSIAAVAQVELITKTADSLSGSRYRIEGGEEKGLEEVGAPDGTTFIMRNLFYNTPARRKFLKSAQTEGGHVADLVEKIALSHPEISIRLIINGQNRLHTSGNHSRKDIIYTVYGREIASNLLPIEAENEVVRIRGFIGKPLLARGNRSFENYFINGRYIKSALIGKAIEDGYKSYMMQHKYPFTMLEVTVEPEYIDVNVHPSKMELRFKDGEMIYRLLSQAVVQTLSGKELIPQVGIGSERETKSADAKKEPQAGEKARTGEDAQANRPAKQEAGKVARSVPQEHPEPFEANRRRIFEEKSIRETRAPYGETQAQPADWTPAFKDPANPSPVSKFGRSSQTAPFSQPARSSETLRPSEVQKSETGAPKPASPVPESNKKSEEVSEPLQQEKTPAEKPEQLEMFDDRLLSKRARLRHRLIGQVFDTYWLVEYNNELYIIDQHAAHEKVLFEKNFATLKSREYTSQLINPPIVLTLSLQEADLLEKHMKIFTDIGFEIEPFGGSDYAVRAVPANLLSLAKKELLLELLDDLSEDGARSGPESVYDRIATMSCKAAVKGNNRLSEAEANELIDELLQLENPYNCPHGRPTIVAISKYEMEKKFKRIV